MEREEIFSQWQKKKKKRAGFLADWEDVALGLFKAVSGQASKLLLRTIAYPALYVAFSGMQVSTEDSVQNFDLVSTYLNWVFGLPCRLV